MPDGCKNQCYFFKYVINPFLTSFDGQNDYVFAIQGTGTDPEGRRRERAPSLALWLIKRYV